MNDFLMHHPIKVAIKEVFKQFDEKDVEAIYLSGSYLNNLHTPTSDVDLYVILKQNKKNLIFGSFVSGQTTGDYDFKYMESWKFIQLVFKVNPNLLEILFLKPLYVSENFKTVTDFLYEHRNELPSLNISRYFSSAYHMAKHNYTKLKNGTGRVLQGQAGKEVVNFYKAYYQCQAVHYNQDISSYVYFTGKLQQKMLDIKLTDSYSEKETEIELLQMENSLNHMKKLKNDYENVLPNKELMNEIITLL